MATKKNKAAEESLLKEVAVKINKVLEESGTVLLPFMQRGELFDFPSVRLAIAKNEANASNK